jgi:IMP dehydrogenase
VNRYGSGKALCFDDILLVPKNSSVKSRHDVDLSMTFGAHNKITLKLPVFAAPMDTVCDIDMCVALSNIGGMGILHRYMPVEELVKKTETLVEQGHMFGVSLGATKEYLADAQKLFAAGSRFFLVDIANGHNDYAVNAVEKLRELFQDSVHIMAGNVATLQGYLNLANAGADSVRVGIGGGSACTTRIVSGHGVPTLASIMDIEKFGVKVQGCAVVADGGIRNSGDMVKCFAAGADAVMVGSMFAGTDESPGDILVEQN